MDFYNYIYIYFYNYITWLTRRLLEVRLSQSRYLNDPDLISDHDLFSGPDLIGDPDLSSEPDPLGDPDLFKNPDPFKNPALFSDPDLFKNPDPFKNPDLFSDPDLFSGPDLFSDSAEFIRSVASRVPDPDDDNSFVLEWIRCLIIMCVKDLTYRDVTYNREVEELHKSKFPPVPIGASERCRSPFL